MNTYQTETWFALYRAALLETQRSVMAGRMKVAREEIARRTEQLRLAPNPSSVERYAIEDALNALKVLDGELASGSLGSTTT